MKGPKVIEAEKVLAEQFTQLATGLLGSYGFKFSEERLIDVWSSSFNESADFYVDIDGSAHQIRLACWEEGQLQVGWGCNNLLTTNSSNKYDTEQIKLIGLVAKIFEDEAKWRDILSRIDFDLLRQAQAEDQAAADAEVARIKAQRLKAFEDAHIVVGTTFTGKGIWGDMPVRRISKSKVQLGMRFYTKEEIGQHLLSGEWQINQ